MANAKTELKVTIEKWYFQAMSTIMGQFDKLRRRVQHLENGRTKDIKRVKEFEKHLDHFEKFMNKPSKLGNMLYRIEQLEMIHADDTSRFPDEMIKKLAHPGYYVIGQCKDCKFWDNEGAFVPEDQTDKKLRSQCTNKPAKECICSFCTDEDYGCIYWDAK